MTLTSISFAVHGIPAPQGGSRAVNTARGPRLITTGGTNLAAWRNDCSAAALQAKGPHPTIDEPVVVTAHFRFPMPKSRPKRYRTAGMWPKSTAPDLDKLCRALGDSLTAAGLLRDDSLITGWDATKAEVWDAWTGVAVMIRPTIATEAA